MAFYFVSTFANAQTPTKQRPYGYRGLKIITSLRLRFPDFQRMNRLDLVWITVRSKHPQQSQEKQDDFKKNLETVQ
ncbi:hypothetical protein BJAS_P3627 [Bathymodiolus japonicus methanotrophic gill symbiont]|uniref:hypothetical protein n=1 Tax=Bathymodiolus japonicus methanotrophic gill symbiont TaxID=113269 RepID=UPI001B5D0A09|nr:hypothetical protein [Bathymodiolus japonicus methanotrophic gill symbiont]GFO73052.1 hypothetical protein BJAS_P3627 [Bathymodiolus japonicus methanotrophic gill symbiont]